MPVTPEYPIKPRCDVTENDEFRTGPIGAWLTDEFAAENTNTYWVEVRPKQQPDPQGVVILDTDGQDSTQIATTVGEMRDRTDLHRWEYANTGYVLDWLSLSDDWVWHDDDPDDFPLIVRRKANR